MGERLGPSISFAGERRADVTPSSTRASRCPSISFAGGEGTAIERFIQGVRDLKAGLQELILGAAAQSVARASRQPCSHF